MTIAPPEPSDALDDAELALAAAGGNQLAFSAIYDRYADRLYDFCVGMLRDGGAAADCVQDVFVTAATKLVQLQDPNRLRAWLYAIARHEALALSVTLEPSKPTLTTAPSRTSTSRTVPNNSFAPSRNSSTATRTTESEEETTTSPSTTTSSSPTSTSSSTSTSTATPTSDPIE
jgi:DNA-directed RNA polymerase specialized sigma24 family protein